MVSLASVHESFLGAMPPFLWVKLGWCGCRTPDKQWYCPNKTTSHYCRSHPRMWHLLLKTAITTHTQSTHPHPHPWIDVGVSVCVRVCVFGGGCRSAIVGGWVCACICVRVCMWVWAWVGTYRGRGGSRQEFSLWNISHFKCVRIFHTIFRLLCEKMISKFSNIACRTVAFAIRSAFVDSVHLHSMGTKPRRWAGRNEPAVPLVAVQLGRLGSGGSAQRRCRPADSAGRTAARHFGRHRSHVI